MVQTFIKKGVFTVCLNLIILLIGYFTIPKLSNEFIPLVEVPAVAVVIPAPTMSETNIKKNIVYPLEKALLRTGELKSIEADIEEGKAVFKLFYKWDFLPEECLRKARQTVENLSLPSGVLDPIFVLYKPSNNPIYRVVFYGEGLESLSSHALKVKSKVERIPGISEVLISGQYLGKTYINVESEKLSQFQVSSHKIIDEAYNTWKLRKFYKGKPLNHTLSVPIKKTEDMKLLPIINHKGSQVFLKWIGNITKPPAKAQVIYGKERPAVILEVIKAPGADTISIINKTLQLVENSKKPSLKTEEIYNEAIKIKESQNGVFTNFFIGVVLNSLILMIFLGSTIGVLVASVVFPTALLGTFFAMDQLSISINLFSLNGFSLAVGMITDASTVVLESITQRINRKEPLFMACWKGVKDVSLGVLASTLTTAGVLLPIAFQKNVSSKLFSDLSLTVVSTQIFCLIAVFSLVPWLCFKMLGKNAQAPSLILYLFKKSDFLVQSMIKLAQSTQRFCRKKLAYKLLIPGSVVFFSLGSVLFLPDMEFLPQVSSRVYSLKYPINNSRKTAEGMAKRNLIASTLKEWNEVDWSVSMFNKNTVDVLFSLKNSRPLDIIKSKFKGSNLDFSKINILPVGPAPSGEAYGYDGLYFIGQNLPEEKINKLIKGFCNSPTVKTCLGPELTKSYNFHLKPSHLTTYRMGLSTYHGLSQFFIPLQEIDLASMADFDFDTPAILKIALDGTLLGLPVINSKGERNIIGELYKHKVEKYEPLLKRKNGDDFFPLFFKLKNSTIGLADQSMQAIRETLKISKNKILGMGTLETMNESFGGLIKALSISAFIVFLILVIQFNSIRQAMVIMGTIPLTLGGAICGLIIMGETVNASVLVGFILLIGIVVNNGIFLVEATNQKLFSGGTKEDAIKWAVSSRTRPILMTSFSTILGMLPTLIIGGEGSELYRGMAIVNVFGMITGTFLSIVVTPIFIENLGIPKPVKGDQGT